MVLMNLSFGHLKMPVSYAFKVAGTCSRIVSLQFVGIDINGR